MKKLLLLVAVPAIFLISCNEEQNDDVVKQPSHDGAVEAVVSVSHENGYDVMTTKYKIWVKGVVDKEFIRSDTLKNLGLTKEEGEDSDGNTKTVSVPRDYEFYITVK